MSFHNQDIIEKLEIMREYYKLIGDIWREKAYSNAIYNIYRAPKIESEEQLRKIKIKGVGKKTMEKMIEFIKTGKIAKEESIKKKIPDIIKKKECVATLSKIYGIGEKKAEHLCSEGYTSIEKLREGVETDPTLLTKTQRLGLEYCDKLNTTLTYKFIRNIEIAIRCLLNQYYEGKYRLVIAGSHRRKSKISGDIDCLISSFDDKIDLQDITSILMDSSLILEKLWEKKEKFLGIGRCDDIFFQLDIEFIPIEEWGSALLYFTGPKNFNIRMRQIAKEKGYTLNQHGLFMGKKRECGEREIFQKLGLEYVEPENR